MAVNLSPIYGAGAQLFNNDGVPLAGGLIYTYAAGTSTPQAAYTSGSGLIQHSNPIVLDASGRVPGGEIWLTDGISYKFVVKDSALVLIGTYDNLIGINSNFVAFTSQEEKQTATQGQTVFTLTTMQYQPGTNNLLVFVNGSKQILGTNYTETSSTVITFVDGLNVGDIVDFTTAVPLASNATTSENVSYNEGASTAVTRTVRSKLQESISVKDFGAVGDGTTDDTNAFKNALTAISDGGTLLIPVGRYKLTDTLTLKTGITIQGQGNADRTFGIPNTSAVSSYIFQTTANKSVFAIGGNTRQLRIKNVSLAISLNPSLTPSSTINGIVMSDTYNHSSTDIVISECSFYNFNKAIWCYDNALPHPGTPDWQCDDVTISQCSFYMNTNGIYLNTNNADAWTLINTDFFNGDNAYGIVFNRSGTFTAMNCFGGQITSTSPVNAYGIYVGGDALIDTSKFINCQWENSTAMLYVATTYYPNQPVGELKIIFDSCEVEADVTLAAACNFVSFSSRYTKNVYVTGSNVIAESYSDYFLSPNGFSVTGSNSSLNNCITSTNTSVPQALNGTILNGHIQRWDTVVPTASGPFKVGDITWNLNGFAGENVGWMCSVAGTPGTWQPFGQIGSRSASGTPIGSVTPFFLGEEYLDTGSNKWYKSIGSTNTSWVALN